MIENNCSMLVAKANHLWPQQDKGLRRSFGRVLSEGNIPASANVNLINIA